MAQSKNEQNRAQLSVLRNLSSLQEEKAIRTDEQVAGTTYIGRAQPGTATSAARWQVSRAVETTSLPITTTVTWADGDAAYDNIWDNRTALSYS